MEPLVNTKTNEGKFSGTKEIREFNETKQYTLIATGVLESLITDPNLTVAAAKLWEYLYTKAIINEKLCVRIKYKDLAQKFHRTERTIKRYVENLKAHGYLNVESNYYNHGQRANTYYLKLPQNIIQGVQNTKDRKQITRVDIVDTLSNASIIKETVVEIQPSREVKSKYFEAIQSDNFVTPDHDINVTQNNNKKEILLNNNVVVSFSRNGLESSTTPEMSLEQEGNIVLRETNQDLLDTQDQAKIDKIEAEINSLFVKMGQVASKEKMTIYDQIRKLQETVSSITVTMEQRKQEKLISFKNNKIEKNGCFVDSSTDFYKTKGERELSVLEMIRIKKAVEKLPKYLNDSERICNEIAYAVRFGALKIAQSGEILSMSHAISIAIKLLREGRWETPAPMKKKEAACLFLKKSMHHLLIPRGHQHIGSLLQTMNMGI